MANKVTTVVEVINKASRNLEKIAKSYEDLENAIAKAKDANVSLDKVFSRQSRGLDRLSKDVSEYIKSLERGKSILEQLNGAELNNNQILANKGRQIKSLDKAIARHQKTILGLEEAYNEALKAWEKIKYGRTETALLENAALKKLMATKKEEIQIEQDLLDAALSQKKGLEELAERYKELGKSLSAVSPEFERVQRGLRKAGVLHEGAAQTVRKLKHEINALASKGYKNWTESEAKIRESLAKQYDRIREADFAYGQAIRTLQKQRAQLDETAAGHKKLVSAIDQQIDALRNARERASETRETIESLTGEMDDLEKSLTSVSSRWRQFNKDIDASNWRKTKKGMEEVFDFSFFRAGVERGLQFYQVQTLILGILPAVAVAVGGLAQTVGALGAGLLGAAGSAGRLAGSLAILPGLYGAIGAGFLGFQNLTRGFITPSIQGAEQMEALNNQLGKAQEAAEKTKEATGPMSFGQARQQDLSQVGANKAKDTASEAASAQKISDIYSQQAKLLEKMPERYQDIADAVEKLKDSWKELWQGGERGNRTTDAIIVTIDALNKVLGDPRIISIAEAYVDMYAKLSVAISNFLSEDNGANLTRIQRLFVGFTDIRTGREFPGFLDNLEKLGTIARTIAPYLFQLFYAVNRFTGKVLDKFIDFLTFKKVETSSGIKIVRRTTKDIATFGDTVNNFLDGSYNSLLNWITALGNFYFGFKNLLDAGDGIDRFEKSLVGVSTEFRNWTERVQENGDAAKYFENSWKILGGLKEVLKGIGSAFGAVMLDDKAVNATVDFLHNLAGGFENLGEFMRVSLVELGPSLNRFFEEIGEFFSDSRNMEAMARATRVAVDMFTGFVNVLNNIPPWVLEWVLKLRIGLFALGTILGGLLTPFIRLGSVIGGVGLKVGEFFGFFKVDDIKAFAANNGPLAFMQRGLSIVGQVLKKIALPLTLFIGGIQGLQDNTLGVRDDLRALGQTLKNDLLPAFSRLWAALTGGEDGKGGIFGLINHLIKLAGSAVFKGFIITLDGMAQALSVLVNIVSSIVAPISAVLDSLGLIFDFFQTWDVSALGAGLKDIWSNAGSRFIEGIVGAGTSMGMEFVQVLAGYGVLRLLTGKGILGLGKGVGDKVKGMASGVGGYLGAKGGAKGATGAAKTAVGRGVARGALRVGAGAVGALGGPLGIVAATLAVEGGFMLYDKIKGNAEKIKGGAEEAEKEVKSAAVATYGLTDSQEQFVSSLTEGQQRVLQLNDDYINARKAADAAFDKIKPPFLIGDDGKRNWDASEGLVREADAALEKFGGSAEKLLKSRDDVVNIVKDAGLDYDHLVSAGWDPAEATAQERKAQSAVMEYLNGVGDWKELDGTADDARKRLETVSNKLGMTATQIIDIVKKTDKHIKDLAEVDTITGEVELLESLAFGGAGKKTAAQIKDLRGRRRRALQVLANEATIASLQEDMTTGGMASPAAYTNTQAEIDRLTASNQRFEYMYSRGTGEQAGGNAAQAETVSSQAESMAGYANTVKGKGAIMQFDREALATFQTQIDTLRMKWIDAFRRMGQQLVQFKDTNVNQFKVIREEMSTTVRDLSTALTSMQKDLNAAFAALGMTAPNLTSGGGSSGEGGIVSRAWNTATDFLFGSDGNDSKTGTGVPASPSGVINNAHMLSELQDNFEVPAKRLLNAIPGVKNIASVLRKGDITSSGNISQHATGSAIDFTMGSKSKMAEAGKWIQANASRFGVRRDQVFYPGHGASGADHEDHVHVGFGGPGMTAKQLQELQLKNPGQVGKGVLGTVATVAAGAFYKAANDIISPVLSTGMDSGVSGSRVRTIDTGAAEDMPAYGDGGRFRANKPTPILVGDKQPEEVRVTPVRGPNKGKYSGGKTTVVNSTINLGTLIANEEGIERLTEEIGKQIRKDVKAARKAKNYEDV